MLSSAQLSLGELPKIIIIVTCISMTSRTAPNLNVSLRTGDGATWKIMANSFWLSWIHIEE